MPAYYTNEAAFDLPDIGFADRTTHLLELIQPAGEEIALVIVRDAMPAGKTLRELVASRVADEMVRLKGYTILETREAAWSTAPAVEVASRWRHEGAAIYQRQAHLALEDQWLYLALSAPFARRARCDEWMEEIRTTLRLRSDPAAP